jgi:twitching motility protein PilT
MTLVPSLLQAIVLMDGEALVLHVGDKPYVVSETGQVNLANTGMTAETLTQVVRELLPAEALRALDDVGATQCVLPEHPQFPQEQFSVVAARGGDDIWVEIRRRSRAEDDGGPDAARFGDSGPAAESPAAPERPSSLPAGQPMQSRARIVDPPAPDDDNDPHAAVVLPLTRTPLRPDAPPPLAETALSGLDRLLRLAAARGASTLYLSSGARPSIRVDGEVRTLDGANVLGPNDVESLLLTLMPERSAEALRSGAASEWISEFDDLGRVRCLGFRDHRGPGGVFRMMPQRAVTTEQLGLSREIQALAAGSDGLLIVTGPRLSGKRTLMSAFVDHINRTRHVHLITVEREINVVHERIGSMISQREGHGTAAMAAAARSALREDPDVLVIEDVRSAELIEVALDAAASGRLVICGFPARSASAAIDGIIDLYPPQQRGRVQLWLAQHLRGVVAQVLLKKSGGGRLAARELLLNTPAVAGLLAEGKTSQLPLAIEGGRKHGMVPLNDALGGFVQSGAVDVREAYRCSPDRPGLLALLQRQGIDVSAVERLA